MRLRKNVADAKAPQVGAKTDLISKLEFVVAAAVDAIENLLRTQFVLLAGGRGRFARAAKQSGRNLSGPYSSLLFSIVVYAAILMLLSSWLDNIENVAYDQRFSVKESLPKLSWVDNLGLIVPMFISVPIAGSALSFVVASRSSARRMAVRDMYVFAISSFIWHMCLLVTPVLAWALLRKQAGGSSSVVGWPGEIGTLVFSDAELLGIVVIYLLITLRVAWIFESNVNGIMPGTIARRLTTYFIACLMLPLSSSFGVHPIIKPYFQSTDHLSILGATRLTDVETIELDLVFTNERDKPIAIKSSDVSLQLWDQRDEFSNDYPIHFYGADDRELTYVILEPGRPTVIAASAYFGDAGRHRGIWPRDRYMLRRMTASICVVSRTVQIGSKQGTRCEGHRIQGPARVPPNQAR